MTEEAMDEQPLKKRARKPKSRTETKATAPKTKMLRGERIGKDEMNLAEHPFASLWKSEGHSATIRHEWEARHPVTGRTLKAFWRVEGSPEMGLPTASDERVYLVLMELTREAGFENQRITFVQRDLLQRLGWPTDAPHYQMLKDAFARLNGVTITTQNAFWNPRAKCFSTQGFSIIDSYEILNETSGPKPERAQPNREPRSWFKWSDAMFESFQNSNIRSLDLSLALSLKRPLSLRLFRYLDKKTNGERATFEISLRELCEQRLNMAVDGRPNTKLKAGLRPAHDELIACGFLQAVSYAAMKTKQGEKVCYVFPPADALPPASQHSLWEAEDKDAPGQLTLDVVADEPVQSDKTSQILAQMLALKVSPDVAQSLLQSTSPEILRLQLDCLSDRSPKDAAAVFVKAAREGWEAPAKYLQRIEAQDRAQKRREAQESAQAAKAAQKAAEGVLKASQDQEAAELDALWQELDAETRKSIDAEAISRLGVLGQAGRAQAGLLAMRRSLLRERLAQD